MFEKIFIEKELIHSDITAKILKRFPKVPTVQIDSYEDIFQKVKKPYLQKRESLNLFIARKKGALVKEAPDAYGLSGEPHFYFINAYNCIYECNYCYLQGYFHSPDLVFFINHDEICDAIENQIKKHQNTSDNGIWFHAGEFSDSLALSHLTNDLESYINIFRKYPKAYLELRTKSANTKSLEAIEPCPNVITSFSLSPADKIKANDLKTPPLTTRLKAIKRLKELGHPIAIHFDPIIYTDDVIEAYKELITSLNEVIPLQEIEYISLGVVRFTKDVYKQVKLNYPKSEYFYSELISSHDNKVKYPRPMRMWLMSKIKELLLEKGAINNTIYLCMEE